MRRLHRRPRDVERDDREYDYPDGQLPSYPATPGQARVLRFLIYYRPIAWPIVAFQALLVAASWIIVYTRPTPIPVWQGATVVMLTAFVVVKCFITRAIVRFVDTYREGLRRDGTR